MRQPESRHAPLRRVRRSSIKQQVFEQLRDGIIRGTWPAGTKLPSESDLGAKLGCSRISIREALQMLASLGLVETRQGGGTFVQSYAGEVLFSPLLPMLALQKQTFSTSWSTGR
jgi:GntR family transcriptional repressor for pyruvate dehydrogenase complex